MIIACYTGILWLYGCLVRLFSFWNPKARALVSGWREDYGRHRGEIIHKSDGVVTKNFELVWIHCASLGEFEMAKPIAAALQAASSQRHVLFSFFSPSGYKHAVLDENQTRIYLPLDGRGSAARFLAQWQPQAAIFIRYEFWFHHLNTTLKNNIPTFALGVSLRPNHFLFSKFATPWINLLQQFKGIGLINHTMTALATQNGLHNTFVFGDPKFNRAYERTLAPQQTHPTLEHWLQKNHTLILGSAWLPEIELLSQFLQKNPNALNSWKILIAPHNVSNAFCEKIIASLSSLKPLIFTQCQSIPHHELHDAKIMILDTIGQLASGYQHGTLAIIGGGFGKGLHNTIEAVAFGLPVIFGPKHQKFPEAQQFIDAGIGFTVSSYEEFEQILLQLVHQSQNQPQHPLKTKAQTFVFSHRANVDQFVKLTYPNAIIQANYPKN